MAWWSRKTPSGGQRVVAGLLLLLVLLRVVGGLTSGSTFHSVFYESRGGIPENPPPSDVLKLHRVIAVVLAGVAVVGLVPTVAARKMPRCVNVVASALLIAAALLFDF
jgi:hypothetical protein